MFLGQKCLRTIVQQVYNKLLHNWSKLDLLHNQQQLNFFVAKVSITNLTTVQLRGILMSWKATEKDFFLVVSTRWGIGFSEVKKSLFQRISVTSLL